MIWIGNQTAYSAATLDEPFAYALSQGFDAFEWFPDRKPDGGGWDETQLDPARRRSIREAAGARGMRLSVHAHWQANPLRRDAHPLFLSNLELAKDLGAALLNIHLYHEAGLAAYVEAITPLVRAVAEAGIALAIENTPEHPPEYFNELFARLRALSAVPTGHVGMCLDLGHANLCAATRNDYLQYVDRLDPAVPITHLHLHENWGDHDSHLPLFTGPSARDDAGIRGLLERLDRRAFAGSMILEQWPQPPTLLNQIRDRLSGLLGLLEKTALPVVPEALNSESPTSEFTPPEGLMGQSHRVIPQSRDGPWESQSSIAPASSVGVSPILQEITSSEVAPRPAAGDFASDLVEANRHCRSWREKLDYVRGLFAPGAAPLTLGNWVDIAVYLRFLGTGQIPCAEDGRHFRPSHHARIALEIQERLAGLATPGTEYLVRKILPWLPSAAQAFQRAEPLTRIRDIAHRNDIPPDLKREIKQSLQNKLHRCAGPEDLATSAALLARVSAPGANYSPDFVEQFRVFHRELQEFFNARSLEDRLRALESTLGAGEAGFIQSFLDAKGASGLAPQLDALGRLTTLRRRLLDAGRKRSVVETGDLLLADVGLEDFAFVLLSEIINAIDAAAEGARVEPALDALVLALANLAMSGVEPEECAALEGGLRAWRQAWDPDDRPQLLRLKATADRCRWLAEDHRDRILALFPKRVEALGHALGVAEHAIRVFCDAEIRGHLIFQFSKLVSGLLRHLRARLALPAWDVLVAGTATGRLRSVGAVEDLGLDLSEPAVVLLAHVEGDEEIPRGVTGLVLAHEIPHLSHLSVRARQARVVLVACAEPAGFQKLEALQGRIVSLEATPDQVTWRLDVSPIPAPKRASERQARLPVARLTTDRAVLPLEEVTPELAGGKADGARRLAELARQGGAGFATPPGIAIPFGVMAAALEAAPGVASEYRRWRECVATLPPGEFAAAAGRLRELVLRLDVPGELAVAVGRRFGRSSRLMVRSSANCEDLEELAGAGLYESVANVGLEELEAAVKTVWASLWTRRATAGRRQAGIPHEQAHMAVLIQRMLTPDYSFVLHTVNPIDRNPRQVYAELAVGLGETLASAAARGTPYRLVGDKMSGATTLLACANFSQGLWPCPTGGVTSKTIDYSRVALSRDAAALPKLGRRLTAIGRRVEEAFRLPQDIEGAVVGDDIFLVQSRPQQGLKDEDMA